jgi:hypothetical protein
MKFQKMDFLSYQFATADAGIAGLGSVFYSVHEKHLDERATMASRLQILKAIGA